MHYNITHVLEIRHQVKTPTRCLVNETPPPWRNSDFTQRQPQQIGRCTSSYRGLWSRVPKTRNELLSVPSILGGAFRLCIDLLSPPFKEQGQGTLNRSFCVRFDRQWPFKVFHTNWVEDRKATPRPSVYQIIGTFPEGIWQTSSSTHSKYYLAN